MEGESEVDDGVYDTSLLLLLLSIVCIAMVVATHSDVDPTPHAVEKNTVYRPEE